ncbi:MAG: hypothetical protein GY731_20090 [Gammaproteobacteria bacterium]|nr:hypothetical protein [Gammaproteobacteria bacterium]
MIEGSSTHCKKQLLPDSTRPNAAMGHTVYGLQLNTDIPIPGLGSQPPYSDAHLRVYLDRPLPWPNTPVTQPWLTTPQQDEQGNPILRVWINGRNGFHFLYADGTQFLINRDATELRAYWPDNLSLEDTATYLLGPVLGFILRLRGKICLHASVIVVDKSAVALLGPAGSGKSTTAAAFSMQGHSIMADDIACLDERHEDFQVLPAYPRLRLWSDSTELLYGSPTALPHLTPNWDKRYLDLTLNERHFQATPLPLTAIYLFEPRSPSIRAPWIGPLSPQEKLMHLVANIHGNYLTYKDLQKRELGALGQLASSVTMRRVTPHSDPGKISNLCTIILTECYGR